MDASAPVPGEGPVGWGGSENPREKPVSPLCPAPLQAGLRAEETNCWAPGFCLQGAPLRAPISTRADLKHPNREGLVDEKG